jgi:glutathione S-transferase
MKLYYFDIYGRAEQIRLLLNHAGVEFEDVRVKFTDWPEMKKDKEKFPFGQMPVLEKDGKYYAQTGAIVRMLGREYGYYPTEAEDIYGVENL